MSQETIGQKIKKYRKEHGITQEQLATSLGYSHKSVITNIEKGHSEMSYEKILLFLQTYGVDANEFFGLSNKSCKYNLDQFKRTEAIFGKEKMDLLYHSKVIVFGVGGVGGHCVDSLARSGVGQIDIVDFDKVEVTNINRQFVASYSSIGKYKVDVMKEHLKDVNPNIKVKAIKKFYLPNNEDEFDLSQYDYIVDCVDNMSAKISLVVKANSLNIPIISALGAGNKIDPTKLEGSDIYKTSVDPLAKILRHELRKRNIPSLKVVFSKEEPIKVDIKDEKRRATPGSTSFVPPTMGLIIASEVIKDLIK